LSGVHALYTFTNYVYLLKNIPTFFHASKMWERKYLPKLCKKSVLKPVPFAPPPFHHIHFDGWDFHISATLW
jgi:hypothetical protein